MAADNVAARSQGADLPARQETGPIDVAGRHEKVAAPPEHVQAVGDRFGARASIVERQENRQAWRWVAGRERIDSRGSSPDTAANGAEVGTEFVQGELVPGRAAARKPARIVEA